MPRKDPEKRKAKHTVRIAAHLVADVEAQAKARGRSFSWEVSRRLKAYLDCRQNVAPAPAPVSGATAKPKLTPITTERAAKLLGWSERTVVRRANTPGDPVHAARIPGTKKPFLFDRAQIEAMCG